MCITLYPDVSQHHNKADRYLWCQMLWAGVLQAGQGRAGWCRDINDPLSLWPQSMQPGTNGSWAPTPTFRFTFIHLHFAVLFIWNKELWSQRRGKILMPYLDVWFYQSVENCEILNNFCIRVVNSASQHLSRILSNFRRGECEGQTQKWFRREGK